MPAGSGLDFPATSRGATDHLPSRLHLQHCSQPQPSSWFEGPWHHRSLAVQEVPAGSELDFFAAASFQGLGASSEILAALKSFNISTPSHVQAAAYKARSCHASLLLLRPLHVHTLDTMPCRAACRGAVHERYEYCIRDVSTL